MLLLQAWRGARKREEEVQLLLDRCAAAVERERKQQQERKGRKSKKRGTDSATTAPSPPPHPQPPPLPLLCRLSLCLRQTAAAGGRLIVDSPSLQTLPKAIDYSVAFGGGGGGSEEEGKEEEEEAKAISTSSSLSSSSSSFISNARNAVVPPRGGLLVSADYAQMELRLAAHLSNDAALLACFGGGGEKGEQEQDPMRVVAAAVFFRRPDELLEEENTTNLSSSSSFSPSSLPATPEAIQAVTPQQRDAAKRLVYGLMYGMGDSALADYLGPLLLPDSSEAEAARVRERVGAALPGLAAWMERIDRSAAAAAVEAKAGGGVGRGVALGVGVAGGENERESDGVVEIATLCGRRWKPSSSSSSSSSLGNVEGRARSFVVQGSASDVFKRALLAVDAAFRAGWRSEQQGKGEDDDDEDNLPPPLSLPPHAARVLLPLHDEILVEVREARHARAAAAVLREKMEGVARELGLRVALPVKVKAGARWGEMTREGEGGWW